MGTRDKEFIRQALTAMVNYNSNLDMVFNKKFLKLQDNYDLKFIELDEDTVHLVSIMKKDLKD